MTQPFPFTYARAQIPVGIGAGNLLYFPLEQGNPPSYVTPLDFTTITSVSFAVTRQKDASVATWTAGLLAAVTTNGLVAVYTFTGTETYISGVYFLRPYATTPSRIIPFDPQPLYVVVP